MAEKRKAPDAAAAVVEDTPALAAPHSDAHSRRLIALARVQYLEQHLYQKSSGRAWHADYFEGELKTWSAELRRLVMSPAP